MYPQLGKIEERKKMGLTIATEDKNLQVENHEIKIKIGRKTTIISNSGLHDHLKVDSVLWCRDSSTG